MAVLLELLRPRDLHETSFEYTSPVPGLREITDLREASGLGSKSYAGYLGVDGHRLIESG